MKPSANAAFATLLLSAGVLFAAGCQPAPSPALHSSDSDPRSVEIADTVTEMTEVKHAYQQGIRAKRGIDF